MARIRTIQPDFARSPSMSRVSREARLLFVLLWTIVDDEGRCQAGLDDLARVLYPSDSDVSMYLLAWLDELEREDCIARYAIGGLDYLRVVRWLKHQRIYHPTPSHLPPPTRKGFDRSGIRETSGKLSGRSGKTQADQRLGGRSNTVPENCDSRPEEAAPIVVTKKACCAISNAFAPMPRSTARTPVRCGRSRCRRSLACRPARRRARRRSPQHGTARHWPSCTAWCRFGMPRSEAALPCPVFRRAARPTA
jgi:hypothetical protein